MLTLQIFDGGDTFYRPLGERSLTVGSGPDADIRLTDPAVEAVHARIDPVARSGGERAYKLVDLDGPSGTLVNGEQVVQVKLALGDRVEIGGAVLILGRRVQRPATSEDVLDARAERVTRRARRGSSPSGGKKLVLVGGLLAIAVAAGLWLSSQDDRPPAPHAEQARLRQEGQFDRARAMLGRLRSGWATGRPRRTAIVEEAVARLEATERAVAALRKTLTDAAQTTTWAEQLDQLKAIEHEMPDSARAEAVHILYGNLREIRSAALAERGRVRPSEVLVEQRHDPDAPERVDAKPVDGPDQVASVLESVDLALRDGQHGQALEILRAALASTPVESAGPLRDRLDEQRREARQEMERLVGQARKLAEAGSIDDAMALLRDNASRFPRSGSLALISSELEGLEQERHAQRAAALVVPPGARAKSGPPVVDPRTVRQRQQTLGIIAELMAQVRAAERQGDFDAARGLLAKAATQVEARDPAFAHQLRGKSDDMGHLVALDELVGRALSAARTATVKLRDGAEATLRGIREHQLDVSTAEGNRQLLWADLQPASVRELVDELGGTAAAWLGAGVLGFRHGDPELAEECLARALGADRNAQPAIDGIIRRGRGDIPDPDGYVLVKGRFVAARKLEAAKLARKLESQLATALRSGEKARKQFLDGVLERGPGALDGLILALQSKHREVGDDIATHSFKTRVFNKLLAERDRLDEARRHAKELIYDEVKYFYPYRPPAVSGKKAAEYWPVQQEVDARVAVVRDLWNKKGVRGQVPRGLTDGIRRFRWLTQVLGEFAERQPEVEEAAAWVRALPDSGDLDIQTYCRDVAERQAFDLYARIEAFNAEVGASLSAAERRQLEFTNAYRRMFGHRPVAINLKVAEAARGHSTEMSTLGYFGHFSPTPGRRTPFDRMRLSGYNLGVSENCAINGSAQGAHVAWIHSSGHHRNLLMASHREFGVGNAGRYWTQNFGTGEEFLENPAFPQPKR